MNRQRHPGLFDLDDRAAKLTALGDPLVEKWSKVVYGAFDQAAIFSTSSGTPSLKRIPAMT